MKDNYYNPKLFNELINKLNLLAYNNKHIIIDTWNNNSNTFSEDLEDFNIEELLIERKKRLNNDIELSPSPDTSDSETKNFDLYNIKPNINEYISSEED